MPNKLFNKLANGQQPRTLGALDNRHDFSRPVYRDFEPVHFARVPIKLGGTELILPSYLRQFEEFAMRSLIDYTNKAPENDYLRTKATLYFSQKRLDPGQFSLATGIHMDIDLNRAVKGDMSNGEIYVASDVSAITTRVYTNPFEIDQQSLQGLQDQDLQDRIEQQLAQQCQRNGSVDPQAFELINFADTQPHIGRSLTDKSVDRTFVFVIFTQDQTVKHQLGNLGALEDNNEDLFYWMIEREMKRAQERHLDY